MTFKTTNVAGHYAQQSYQSQAIRTQLKPADWNSSSMWMLWERFTEVYLYWLDITLVTFVCSLWWGLEEWEDNSLAKIYVLMFWCRYSSDYEAPVRKAQGRLGGWPGPLCTLSKLLSGSIQTCGGSFPVIKTCQDQVWKTIWAMTKCSVPKMCS